MEASYYLKSSDPIPVREGKKSRKRGKAEKKGTSSESEESENDILKEIIKELNVKIDRITAQLQEHIKQTSEYKEIINEKDIKIKDNEKTINNYKLMLKAPTGGEEYDSEDEFQMDAEALCSTEPSHEHLQQNPKDPEWQIVTGRRNRHASSDTNNNNNNEEFPLLQANKNTGGEEFPKKSNDVIPTENTGLVNKVKPKASPPVIKIYNSDVKLMTVKIRDLVKHTLFSIKIINKNMIELKLNTIEDHHKVKHYLNENKINFYTYTPFDLKPFSILIRGLSSTYDVEDIKEHFELLEIQLTINRIIKLNGDRWLVQLSHDSDLKSVLSVKFFLNCRVRLERFKRGGLIQCRNCQRYGHVSSNCSMPYRCVKCSLSHGPGNCKIPKRELNIEEYVSKDQVTGTIIKRIGLPVRCVNCDSEGHVASSQSCPRRKEIKQRLDDRRAERRQAENTPAKFMSSYRTKGTTYAAAMGPNLQPSKYGRSGGAGSRSKAGELFCKIDSDCVKYLGKDIVTCMDKIGDFAEEYSRIKGASEKTRALWGLLIGLRLND